MNDMLQNMIKQKHGNHAMPRSYYYTKSLLSETPTNQNLTGLV